MKKSKAKATAKPSADTQSIDAPMTYDPVADLGLKTGVPQCVTIRDLHAEYCMRSCGLAFGVAVGFDLHLRRPIDAKSNPSRTGCEIDQEHVARLLAHIQNHEQLLMPVAYERPEDSQFDFASGNHRVVAFERAGIRYVNVYIIKYDPLKKEAIEDILPWRLNIAHGKAVSQELYIEKALSLLKQGKHTETEVCEMFSLRIDMLHQRREHRIVVDALKDCGIHVPKAYADSKTLLADLNKIDTEVVRNEAAKLAMAAEMKAQEIKDLTAKVNKVTRSEAAKLAYIRDYGVELGVRSGTRVVSDAEAKVRRIAVAVASKPMRTWLKQMNAAVKLVRKMSCPKDSKVTNEKELAEIRAILREHGNKSLVISAR